MGAKKPGPTCSTNEAAIDAGTLTRHRHEGPVPTGCGKQAPGPKAKIEFVKLWNAYPDKKPYLDAKTGEPPSGYENQCAIKVSVALHGAGVDMTSFKGRQVLLAGHKAAVGASQLAEWLEKQRIQGIPAHPQNITGPTWQDTIKGRTGIVYFANYWLRSGETRNPTGDHIDLWNGWRLTASGLAGAVVTVLRFGLGVDTGPGFSDLGKATKILFWEIR